MPIFILYATTTIIFLVLDAVMLTLFMKPLFTRHLGDLPTAIYAAKSYLERCGRPQTVEDLLDLDFVGFDRSDLILRMMASLGIARRREDFALRCDDQVVYWALVRAG